jgi:hypothetical protein
MVSQEVTRTFIICKDSYFICHLLEQQPKKSSLETMKCVRVPTCNPKITPYSPIRYLIFDTIHQVFQDDDAQLLDLKLENILWLNNTNFHERGNLAQFGEPKDKNGIMFLFLFVMGSQSSYQISACVPCEAIRIWPSNKLLLAYLLSIFYLCQALAIEGLYLVNLPKIPSIPNLAL